MIDQYEFNRTIGELDFILSKMVRYSEDKKVGDDNQQTLKHHAEDMISAGKKILSELGIKE